MRRLPGTFAGVLLALAACGVPPTNQLQPGSHPQPARRKHHRLSRPTVRVLPARRAATPAEVPKAQQFKLDDAAEFDDGLLIEIAGTVADKATKTDRGAEATNGQIVIASVRIENKTKKSYDAKGVLIGCQVRRWQGCADHHRQDRRAAERLHTQDQTQG